jgi:hypothetical protein
LFWRFTAIEYGDFCFYTPQSTLNDTVNVLAASKMVLCGAWLVGSFGNG